MDEWWKILVSTIVGLAAGLLAEPVKQAIGHRMLAKNVRQRIYYDFGRILFYVTPPHPEWSKETLISISRTDAFDFYHDVKRESLYLVPEFQAMINFGSYIKQLRKKLQADELKVADVVRSLSESFEQYRRTSELRWPELQRHKDCYSKHFHGMSAAIRATKAKSRAQENG